MRYVCALTLALLIVAWPGRADAQTTWRVPSVIQTIADAVDTASAGDLVLVANQDGGNPPYAAFEMKTGVRVAADAGQAPKISGSGVPYAVEFPFDADEDTILEGFAEITGGSQGCVRLWGQGVVRNSTLRSTSYSSRIGVNAGGGAIEGCVIDVAADRGVAVVEYGTVTLIDTEIHVAVGTAVRLPLASQAVVSGCLLTGGSYGVDASSARAVVTGCTLEGQALYGVRVVTSSSGSPSEVADNIFVSDQDDAVGIQIQTPNQETVVSGNTIDGWGTGILISSLGSLAVIEGNVVVNAAEIGIDCNGQDVILNCNDAYNNGPTGEENYDEACSRTQRNFELNPLFCDGQSAELETYTLRIDSPCTASYSGCSGGIGARGVECAWGTLARSTTVAANEEVLVIGDLTVPSTRSLTLASGVTFSVLDADSVGGGDGERVELTVSGDLVVEGGESPEDRVVFQGVDPSPGSWWGIYVPLAGTASVANADFKHGQFQLAIGAADSSFVTGCTFRDYEQYGMVVGNGDGMHFLAEGDTLYSVDGATGICLTHEVDGVRIEGNEIWGDEPMLAGITTDSMSGAPLIAGNHVSGLTVSEGIKLTGGSPDLVENEITGNLTGILVTGGTPRIGLGSSSDNVITQNEDGIVITGGVPVIRNNQIVENRVWGVRVQNDADPNLGTDPDSGQNTFLNNDYGCLINENPGGTPTVRAVGNYFGVCDGGFPEVCWSGNVDVGTWLCTAPAAARRPDISRVAGPARLALLGARPNPTVAGSGIAFRVEGERRAVGARVFDVAGRLVRELAEQPFDPGDHVLAWDGMAQDGRPVRTGMYFVRVTAGAEPTGTVKVLVAR